jgi:hypothetical protein
MAFISLRNRDWSEKPRGSPRLSIPTDVIGDCSKVGGQEAQHAQAERSEKDSIWRVAGVRSETP